MMRIVKIKKVDKFKDFDAQLSKIGKSILDILSEIDKFSTRQMGLDLDKKDKAAFKEWLPTLKLNAKRVLERVSKMEQNFNSYEKTSK